ncbi:12507_t:CDS:1 [Ambispora leptoticha]|uniref:12507_t:CDS:1 n=1 Tax=Ambispora leptoticha TaxID=144679 RepID=A0A9N9B7Y0_9GLOM|nr:12507_t:CDS:1 [Ambispora leptoticha]
MNYSCNVRAHALYSGILGAFLEPNDNDTNSSENNSIYNKTLRRAAIWLAQNNPYLHSLANNLSSERTHEPNNPFSRARHTNSNAPAVNPHDIVILNYNFLDEIHNEDFHYTRLMAGFVQKSDNLRLPISIYDPNLEPLLFPDLFTDDKEHFHDILNQLQSNNEMRIETYEKYIKQRLMNIDPRWRLHHYWPSWSYLQLEKLRYHQNMQCLLRQNSTYPINNEPLPSGRDLLQPSNYTSRNILNENIIIPVPSFVRTGNTYFHQKQLHLNAMLQKFRLPTLFITLSMAESRWTHLHDILCNSDNGDTLPTNRPFHCANYFVHRFQSLKNELYKKPDLTRFGDITNFFDKVEFQNRGAVHMHNCYWTTNTIEVMISTNVIRSTVPDPEHESELYAAVLANQIHTCDARCQGPAIPACKKRFPRPFSETTHYEENNSRYTYKCLSQADS